MLVLQKIIRIGCVLLGGIITVSAQAPVEDSIQQALVATDNPSKRVTLLLNLKDLNEGNSHNLPYSIQLFREAAAIGNTHAMSASIITIVNRYATYIEKEDSLKYYLNALRKLTPGTPEEGTDIYAELVITYKRLDKETSPQQIIRKAHQTLRWCDSLQLLPQNIYRQTASMTMRGYANMQLDYYESGRQDVYIPQTKLWREAYELTYQMPEVGVQERFAHMLYIMLSGAYNQAHNYAAQIALTQRHIHLLDRYYADKSQHCRPYFYADNSYVVPYQQLMLCAHLSGHKEEVKQHFQDFRARMLRGKTSNLLRNKTYIYETGYLLQHYLGNSDQSILYCDSLIDLIARGEGYYCMKPTKIYRVHRDKGRLLYQAKRYHESAEAYQRTLEIQDSIYTIERNERIKTICQSHEMDRLKLKKTRNQIHNQTIATLSSAAIVLCLLSLGIYHYMALRSNRKLQANIILQNRKAQESERMKSSFISTICHGISPPMEAIDRIAQQITTANIDASTRPALLKEIHKNTTQLLSALDNLLEAANLHSMTEGLELNNVDINDLCRTELRAVSQQNNRPEVSFDLEIPDTACIVRTHARYFSGVVRVLLNNANKFTQQGHITLSLELQPEANLLMVTVTDTGCGIPPAQHEEIFQPLHDHSSAPAQGLSLALCCLIAKHLAGSLRLDTSYTQGARFIFTIPAKP